MTSADHGTTVTLEVTQSELETIRTALRVLLSTMGKEEADQIDEIQELFARIPEASTG